MADAPFGLIRPTVRGGFASERRLRGRSACGGQQAIVEKSYKSERFFHLSNAIVCIQRDFILGTIIAWFSVRQDSIGETFGLQPKQEIDVFNKKIKSAMKLASISVFACAATLSAGSASAVALLGQAPDASVIVQAGGFEWVYAGPCAGTEPSCGVVQLHHDFGFATDAQWNASFSDLSALMAAFVSDGAVRCAATYFNTVYDQCDVSDAGAGYVWNSPLAPSEGQRTNPAGETFLVRAGADAPTDVPEPGSLALVGLGLMGFAVSRRRQAAKK